jgi:hypothetical protein
VGSYGYARWRVAGVPSRRSSTCIGVVVLMSGVGGGRLPAVSYSVEPACCAHVDEGGVRLADGGRLYGLAAVLTSPVDHVEINAQLGCLLLPARTFLHHYDETAERRVKIANTIAALPIHGAIVVTAVGTHTRQERARARLIAWLLPHLQHVERVDEVVFESRSGGDRHDRRTAERLRRSRRITGQIKLRHGAKAQEPLTWLADFVIGSYMASFHHDESVPWNVLSAAHAIDVVPIGRE